MGELEWVHARLAAVLMILRRTGSRSQFAGRGERCAVSFLVSASCFYAGLTQPHLRCFREHRRCDPDPNAWQRLEDRDVLMLAAFLRGGLIGHGLERRLQPLLRLTPLGVQDPQLLEQKPVEAELASRTAAGAITAG
jgi:hypothetical protein